jgi:RNA polymerase sigma-70 factor (ECF subfamily)
MTAEPLRTHRTVDAEAFERLAGPHRRHLQLHCYRMLGSLQDAEDAVQETFLRAWRRLETFEGRSSFRTWLYRIATNACLDALDRRPPRLLPDEYGPPGDPRRAPAPPVTEGVWLDPYPDALLELLEDAEPGPEAVYDVRESVRLAFVAALQHLPPRQRAVLLLRDVLGWSAAEVAGLLEVSVVSVNSSLQRARATLSKRAPTRDPTPAAVERSLLDRYVRAWNEADVDALVALLKEDATLTMPPVPSWFRGRAAIAAFLSTTPFGEEWRGRLRVVPTGANGQPACAVYERAEDGVDRPFAVMVLTLDGGSIAAITGFTERRLFPLFAP